MLIITLYIILLMGSCGYAAIAGQLPGRLIAFLFMAASVITAFADSSSTWQNTVHVYLIIDAAVLVALWILAMSFNRWWLIWCAGLHLVTVATHIATIISPTFTPLVYQSVAQFWSVPILSIMAVGIAKDNRALRTP